MATIIFYLFILISSTFFVYISDKGKGLLERRVFLTIAFLLVFIPSAIRYDIGTDFLNYINIYENIDIYTYLEPGFYLLNWTLNYLNVDSQWVFVLTSLIFTIAFFVAYPPKSGAWILHFAMMTLLWFISFNTIRQALSTAICFYAIFYFFDKKYVPFFLFTLLATTFHTSAIIILLVGLIALIPLKRSLMYLAFPNIFIGLMIISYIFITVVTVFIGQILGFIGLEQYLGYFDSGHFSENNLGSGLGALVKMLFCVYVIFNTKYILQMNQQYWIIILLTFFYGLGSVLATNIIIFSRMQQTFLMAPIIACYLIYRLPQNKQLHKTVISLFFIFLFLTFIKESIGAKSTYSDPKINPYQTISSRPY